MENRNFLEELTQYRVKVERNGKPVLDVPGILCLPGLLMAPRLSIVGMIAAPLLGYSMHLGNEDGKAVKVEEAVRETADSIMETAAGTARTIKEEIDKAWQALSAEDPEDEDSEAETPETGKEASEDVPAQEIESNQDIIEDLKKHEANDIPTIQVNPDDSEQE